MILKLSCRNRRFIYLKLDSSSTNEGCSHQLLFALTSFAELFSRDCDSGDVMQLVALHGVFSRSAETDSNFDDRADRSEKIVGLLCFPCCESVVMTLT